ncbi:hypothetical protein [Thermomonas paludicola]|uniref:hypothetical protein n=1 Tax=Thermomonas paludicola TaxID=2884874 RepID=UPI00211473F5|nr:hypothetical protein [Thermomonas paludicola]
MIQPALVGNGYRLEFDFQPPLLTVRLLGAVAAEANLAVTREYWLRIAERARECGAGQLLVLDELPGEVMGDADLARFFDEISGMGLERVQIAYVEGRLDQIPRIEYVEQLALERGYRARVFGNESDALLWLRYGGG